MMGYQVGQIVGIVWDCKDAHDGGTDMPEGFDHAIYARSSEGRYCHCIHLVFKNGEMGNFFPFEDCEVFPIIEEDLKVEDFL
jgi:hypothetical protein